MLEQLTPRELEVVELVAQGLDNVEIADRLYAAISTVVTHISLIYSKFLIEPPKYKSSMQVKAVLIYLKERGSKND